MTIGAMCLLPPFPVLCPGATRCRTACLCYAVYCADETSSVLADHLRPFPASADTVCREEARKGRRTGVDQTHPQALLLPGDYRASVVGTVTAQLRFLLSTLLLDTKHDATDRFIRDPP